MGTSVLLCYQTLLLPLKIHGANLLLSILPSIFSSENELEWTGSLFLPPFLLNISPLFLFVSLSIKLPTVALTTLH